jgi:hypothetical protein
MFLHEKNTSLGPMIYGSNIAWSWLNIGGIKSERCIEGQTGRVYPTTQQL